jgi:hypothetical protein
MYTETVGPEGRRQRRYECPENCTVKEFVIRELTGHDDIQIAAWVDRKASASIAENFVAVYELKRNEAIRCSLVTVDGKPVNEHGVPYAALDDWSVRTLAFLTKAFNSLNGVEPGELKKFDTARTEEEIPTSLTSVRSIDERSAG